MRYFVQLQDEQDRFDEVDEFVFNNRKFAMTASGRRYTDGYITLVNGTITVCGSFPCSMVGHLPRMLGVSSPSVPSKAFFDEPETVLIQKGRSVSLYNLKDKTVWKRAA